MPALSNNNNLPLHRKGRALRPAALASDLMSWFNVLVQRLLERRAGEETALSD